MNEKYQMQNVKLLSGFVFAAFLIFNFTFYIGGAFAQTCPDLVGGTDYCPTLSGTRCSTYNVMPSCGAGGSELTPTAHTTLSCSSCTFTCALGWADCSGGIGPGTNGCETENLVGRACTTGSGEDGTYTGSACSLTCAATPRYASRQYSSPGAQETGHLNVQGDIRSASDLYLSTNKAIRVDGPGPDATVLNIGNWDEGGTLRMNVFGALTVSDDTPGTSRVRITDTLQNPELELKYGAVTKERWALYVDHGDDNKLKLWGAGEFGATRMTIDSAGKVGIGTTVPTQPLDVTGNARFTGDLSVGGLVSGARGSFIEEIRTNAAYINGAVSAAGGAFSSDLMVSGSAGFGGHVPNRLVRVSTPTLYVGDGSAGTFIGAPAGNIVTDGAIEAEGAVRAGTLLEAPTATLGTLSLTGSGTLSWPSVNLEMGGFLNLGHTSYSLPGTSDNVSLIRGTALYDDLDGQSFLLLRTANAAGTLTDRFKIDRNGTVTTGGQITIGDGHLLAETDDDVSKVTGASGLFALSGGTLRIGGAGSNPKRLHIDSNEIETTDDRLYLQFEKRGETVLGGALRVRPREESRDSQEVISSEGKFNFAKQFDTAAEGFIVLGAQVGTSCDTVCGGHGLDCNSVQRFASTQTSTCNRTDYYRYCLCDG